MYSCRVLKDVCSRVAVVVVPPVGGSFIDFSRSAAHTVESSAPLMSLVVIFAPLAPFLCLSHLLLFIVVVVVATSCLLMRLVWTKWRRKNSFPKMFAAKSCCRFKRPSSSCSHSHAPGRWDSTNCPQIEVKSFSYTHLHTKHTIHPPPTPLLLFSNPHCRRPHIVIVIVIKINFISAFGHFWERLKRNSSKNEANWGTNIAVPTPPTARLTDTL